MKHLKPWIARLLALLAVGSTVTCSGCLRLPDASELLGESTSGETKVQVTGQTEQVSYYDPDDDPSLERPSHSDFDFRLQFLCAGDCIGHDNVFLDAKSRGNGKSYQFTSMFDGIADMIRDADISFINQETVMAGASYGYHGYPNFNTPQELGDTLVELGFDVINIANNHMLDMKEAGLVDTAKYWKSKKDVLLLGYYEDRTDYDTIRVYEYESLKIAFLTYTYGTNGMTLTSSSNRVIPLINKTDITRQVKLAQECADLVFVSMHWGDENKFALNKQQLEISQLLVDLGVDVVIGTHPHLIQPMEWATNSAGHRTLVIYSLGNLLSTMYNAYNMISGIVTFDIVSESGSKPYIDNPVFHPVVCHYDWVKDMNGDGVDERRNLQIYKLEDYTAAMCESHGSQKFGYRFNLSTLRGYVTKNIPEEFLPDYLKTGAKTG